MKYVIAGLIMGLSLFSLPSLVSAQTPKERVEVRQETIQKAVPSYGKHLKRIIEDAQNNIKRIDKELAREAARNISAQKPDPK